jgi:hypothetical protein
MSAVSNTQSNTHSVTPTFYYWIGGAALIAGIALAALGGTPLLGHVLGHVSDQGLLDPTRISLLAAGGAATLTSVALFAIGCRLKHSPDEKLRLEKKKVHEERELIVNNRKTLNEIVESELGRDQVVAILRDPRTGPALKEYYKNPSESWKGDEVFRRLMRDDQATVEQKQIWLEAIKTAALDESKSALEESKSEYENIVKLVLTTKDLDSKFKTDFLTKEKEVGRLPERLQESWYTEIEEKKVCVEEPTLTFLAHGDRAVSQWLLENMPNLDTQTCVVKLGEYTLTNYGLGDYNYQVPKDKENMTLSELISFNPHSSDEEDRKRRTGKINWV